MHHFSYPDIVPRSCLQSNCLTFGLLALVWFANHRSTNITMPFCRVLYKSSLNLVFFWTKDNVTDKVWFYYLNMQVVKNVFAVTKITLCNWLWHNLLVRQSWNLSSLSIRCVRKFRTMWQTVRQRYMGQWNPGCNPSPLWNRRKYYLDILFRPKKNASDSTYLITANSFFFLCLSTHKL